MLSAGLAAGLLPILVYAYFAQEAIQKYDHLTALRYLLASLAFLIPGLLISFTSYVHVVKGWHWGIVLLWPIGLVNEVAIVLALPGLAFAFQGRQTIFPILALEFILVIAVLLLSIFLALAKHSARNKSLDASGKPKAVTDDK